MAKLVIRIADGLTKYRGGTRSWAGHMWFEVQSLDNKPYNFVSGFASVGGVPVGKGQVLNSDSKNYETAYYTAVLDITESQAKKLLEFNNNPKKFGFDNSKYNAATHSCVDYVFKALQVIGKNPNYDKGEQGDSVPANNVDDLKRLLGKQIISESYNVVLNKFSNRSASYEVRSLDENTAELLTVSANHNPVPNDFTKLVGQANNLINAMSVFGSDNTVASFANHDPYAANMPQLAVAA